MNSPISSPRSSFRLLIVDDETAVLDLLEIVLGSEGHRLTTATNGPEALCFFEEDDFDLVITDRNMPEMDGEALAAEIKRRDPRMPILLISGHPPPTLDTAKFDLILAKPFTKQALLNAIHALT